MWGFDSKTKIKHSIAEWDFFLCFVVCLSFMHACIKLLHTEKQLFPVVPHASGRGGCGLMADTDWALRGGGEHKQSPLWQFPDVSQQSTWLADDSPGRCGHFLDSSTLFLHRPCKRGADRNRLSNFTWDCATVGRAFINYHTVQSQKHDQHVSVTSFHKNNSVFTES